MQNKWFVTIAYEVRCERLRDVGKMVRWRSLRQGQRWLGGCVPGRTSTSRYGKYPTDYDEPLARVVITVWSIFQ